MINLYSPTVKYQVVLQKTWFSGLALGSHTAVIEVSGQKNSKSKDHAINIDAFEVIP